MKKLYFLILFLSQYNIVKAQSNDYHFSLETQGIVTTNDHVPFWLRANQFGSVPSDGASGSLIAQMRKDYDQKKTFDWAFSFEGRGNLGNHSRFILVEGLVKAHAGIFELKVGRMKDIIGLTDSVLSSGAFAISGNAPGIPKAVFGIPDYYNPAILGRLFAFKATLGAGLAGNVPIDYRHARVNESQAYYLENQAYFRVGMPNWRFKFIAGFNHEVIWGDEKEIFPNFKLSRSQTLWYVLSGKKYHSSKVGNHLGSLDVGAEYRFNGMTLLAYRQNFYDKGGLASLANIADGLNGISLTNNKARSSNFYLNKLVFEVLYTANQAGGLNAKRTASGYENYYNNYEYNEGWSYKGLGLGTPFITTVVDARAGLASYFKEYFINNRLTAFHTATQLYVYKWLFTGKFSYSINQGNYITGTDKFKGSGGDIITPGAYGVFKKVNQLSVYAGGSRPLKNGFGIGCDMGYDNGGLLYNSFGLVLKASKSFF